MREKPSELRKGSTGGAAGWPLLKNITLSSGLLLGLSASGQVISLVPERFGVVDVTPNSFSGEANQNSEPSLALHGRMMVHAFTRAPLGSVEASDYYTAGTSSGPWANGGPITDFDASLDWSPRGTCYMAIIPALAQIQVLKSTDPANTSFSIISSATITKGAYPYIPDQPWLKVVNVTNEDHIFVGYNDLSVYPGKTPTVRYSMDSGMTWQETVIERVASTIGWDSPAVRLATTPDGETVYALFQRSTNWAGGAFSSDFKGEVVLTRDDGFGGTGFGGLGNGGEGTKVAGGIVLPWGTTTLGQQRLGSDCDVAVDPNSPSTVYVAYTDVSGGVPSLHIAESRDSGETFASVWTRSSASIPAIAVNIGGTFGMLYAVKNGTDLEVHFLKAFGGDFSAGAAIDRVLAKFPDNKPQNTGSPYIGDYFNLKTAGYDFFGSFCASGDPQPDNFPSGVYFQRNVNVVGTTKHDFWLSAPGRLVDLSDIDVTPSIDPFVFYDIAPFLIYRPILLFKWPFIYDPGDPFSGFAHVSWPVLPAPDPPFQLFTSPTLGVGANWTLASSGSVVETNGQNLALLSGTNRQQFFRVKQDLVGAQFRLFASAGPNGDLRPSGIFTNPASGAQTFTATPSNNYAVGSWFLDGVLAQRNGGSFTVSNLVAEHTLTATFIASNNLAVTLSEFCGPEGPTETQTTNSYVIEIENKGLNTLTGIRMTNLLDPTVEFVSALSSQGTLANEGRSVIADVGTLTPGALAAVTIRFVPLVATNIFDTAAVGCDQFEPNLSDNFASATTAVIEPVIITKHPDPLNVGVGETATFAVSVIGTPPFVYQWFYNTTNLINNATNASLTLTNVGQGQSGEYSVSVLQILSPEEVEGESSRPATLTVQ